MEVEVEVEVEVEIEGEDGCKLPFGVRQAQNTVLGRGCGFNTKDRTVSRRHVSFQLNSDSELRVSVSFEVIGRNPIWVWSTTSDGGALRLFRKFDKGHLQFGDRFSFSAKTPFWFHFNKHPTCNYEAAVAVAESENDNEGPSSRADLDLDLDQIDLSQIDPVKEFGFLVMGHEFDHYPKGMNMIRNVKDWEWFLEEPSKDSDEEEDEGKERRKMRRKRKKGKDNEDDEEWGGESEVDKDLVAKIRKGKRPRYSTRSKDSEKGPNRNTKGSSSTSSKRKKATNVDETVEEEEDDDDDDDNDETLGGFIADDEENDQQEEESDEEEEEFEDDDDDDDD